MAVEQQVELERQAPGGRHGLLHAAPVEQALERHLAAHQHAGARLARAALGADAAADAAAQGLGAEALGAQAAVGVVAEVALELGQFQGRLGDLQARALGGEVHHHPRLLRLFLGQRDVQVQVALERALAFPAGEDLLHAQGRVLENLQAVAQAAVDVAVDMQVGDFALGRMGNVHLHVADLALQDAPGLRADAHAAVLHQHLALGLAQRRPARLVVQLAVVDLEVQAHGVVFRRRALFQRTLPLEVALLDAPALDGAGQPAGQVLVHLRQHRGQELRGVAAVAVLQAHAQVHVAFLVVVVHQADQHVAAQAADVALDLHQVAAKGEGLVVPLPEQPRVGAAEAPRLGEQGGQVEHEVLGRGVQLAAAEVAAEGAVDVGHRWNVVEGADADLLQVHAVGQALGALALRPPVEVEVVQHALRRQALQPLHSLVRQGRQAFHHRQQRAQVQAVGAQAPVVFAAGLPVQFQFRLAPALFAEVGRQIADAQAHFLALALEVQPHAEVADLHRLAAIEGGLHLRRIEPGHRRAGLALVDARPELAAGLQALDAPLPRQARRQPLRPVALRQAEVGVGRAALPVLAVDARVHPQRHRLAVGQVEAAIQALAEHAAVQGQAEIGQVERLPLARQQAQLAVQQRQAARRQQQVDELARVATLRAGRQALDLPVAVLALAQAQVQPLQFQAVDARLARQQAGGEVGGQANLLQAQGVAALAELDVAHRDDRAEAAPAAFQGADAHRHVQPRAGLLGQVVAIFRHQRHQLAPQADVQRQQHQAQGAKPQEQAQQAGEQAAEAVHLSRAPQSRTTSYCSWEYIGSTWNLMVRPMNISRSATLPDSSSSRRSTTFWLASTT